MQYFCLFYLLNEIIVKTHDMALITVNSVGRQLEAGSLPTVAALQLQPLIEQGEHLVLVALGVTLVPAHTDNELHKHI